MILIFLIIQSRERGISVQKRSQNKKFSRVAIKKPTPLKENKKREKEGICKIDINNVDKEEDLFFASIQGEHSKTMSDFLQTTLLGKFSNKPSSDRANFLLNNFVFESSERSVPYIDEVFIDTYSPGDTLIDIMLSQNFNHDRASKKSDTFSIQIMDQLYFQESFILKTQKDKDRFNFVFASKYNILILGLIGRVYNRVLSSFQAIHDDKLRPKERVFKSRLNTIYIFKKRLEALKKYQVRILLPHLNFERAYLNDVINYLYSTLKDEISPLIKKNPPLFKKRLAQLRKLKLNKAEIFNHDNWDKKHSGAIEKMTELFKKNYTDKCL